MKNTNRQIQLNPNNEEFLKSREATLTEKHVKVIQQAEVKAAGFQSPDGLGAKAQKILSKK
jgi:hypothetical protein